MPTNSPLYSHPFLDAFQVPLRDDLLPSFVLSAGLRGHYWLQMVHVSPSNSRLKGPSLHGFYFDSLSFNFLTVTQVFYELQRSSSKFTKKIVVFSGYGNCLIL